MTPLGSCLVGRRHYFIRDKLAVQKGETVLVNGAPGAVGTNAVQLAKYFGANVTGVTSTSNEKLVRIIGVDRVIDYTKQDVATSEEKFDVVLDAVGTISPHAAKSLLTSRGRAGLMVATLWEGITARKPVVTGSAAEKKEDIEFLLKLTEEEKIKVIIDKVYGFDDIVAAHHHVDSGKKVGNVLIRL